MSEGGKPEGQVHATPYRSKQELAADYLRDAILAGELKPEARLRQEDVARALGLSWTPVREAFRQLEVEGWVRLEHHRGAVVTSISRTDFEDIYQLRILTEPPCARMSVERLDEATLIKLEAIHQDFELRLADPEDWGLFLDTERAFHGALYRASASPRLVALVMGLRDASYRYLRASITVADEPRRHAVTHQRLIVACREHDADAAAGIMEEALMATRDRVLEAMANFLEQATEG